jgi:flagellar protein FliS
MTYGLKTYQSTRAQTASREDLLIMLYEGAIRFLEQSIVAKQKGNLSEHKTLLSKGRAIIEEFQNTLDMEVGGDLAYQLFELYAFMLENLTKANVKVDVEPIRQVVEMLSILLEGWRDAINQVKNGTANVAGPTAMPQIPRLQATSA